MDPAQVVLEQLDAYNARHLERCLSSFRTDAVVEDATGNVMARGVDEMRELYRRVFSQSPSLHVDIPQRIHVGSYVIDEEQVTGLNIEGFPSELHGAVVYRVEGDKIVSARMLL